MPMGISELARLGALVFLAFALCFFRAAEQATSAFPREWWKLRHADSEVAEPDSRFTGEMFFDDEGGAPEVGQVPGFAKIVVGSARNERRLPCGGCPPAGCR